MACLHVLCWEVLFDKPLIYRSTLWRKIFIDVVGQLKQEWINSAGKKHNESSMFSGLPWNNQTYNHVLVLQLQPSLMPYTSVKT